MELSWKIEAKEKAEMKRKAIGWSFVILVPIMTLALMNTWLDNSKESGIVGLYILLIFILGFVVAYIRTYFPYKEYDYKLSDNGILVRRGQEERFFPWDEFAYFYTNPDEQKNNLSQIGIEYYQKMKNVRGEKLFLLLKSEKGKINFSSSVLVLYSKPENYNSIIEMISTKIPLENIQLPACEKYLFK